MPDHTVLFWAASVVASLGFAAHVVLGNPIFVRPLLANTTLPVEVKWVSYVCWHVASIVLFGLAIAFAYAATRPGNAVLAGFSSAMSGAVSILGFVVGVRGNSVLLKLPAPYLFGLIALLGVAGVLRLGG